MTHHKKERSVPREGSIIKQERDMIKKEKDILDREKEILKQEEELTKLAQEYANRRIEDIKALYMRRQILDHLDHKYNFEVPESLWQQEIENLTRRINQERMSEEDRNYIMEKVPSIARRRVKLGMVLSSIANHYNIEVTPGELGNVAKIVAREYNTTVDAVMNDSDLVQKMKSPVIEDKTIQFLLSKTTNSEMSVGYADLDEIESYCHQESDTASVWYAPGNVTQGAKTSVETGTKSTAVSTTEKSVSETVAKVEARKTAHKIAAKKIQAKSREAAPKNKNTKKTRKNSK